MLKSSIDAVYQRLVNNRRPVLGLDRQREILDAAKNIRCVDYVSNFVVPQNVTDIKAQAITTRANWVFILCGIQLWTNWAGAVETLPRIGVEFRNIPEARFFREKTDPDFLDTVPARLCVGCEANDHEIANFPYYHYEEGKNVLFILPERANIETTILPYVQLSGFAQMDYRGAVLYSGLEVSMEFLRGGE